eukprot:PhM_4_TR8233/c1_g1_i3/m.60342
MTSITQRSVPIPHTARAKAPSAVASSSALHRYRRSVSTSNNTSSLSMATASTTALSVPKNTTPASLRCFLLCYRYQQCVLPETLDIDALEAWLHKAKVQCLHDLLSLAIADLKALFATPTTTSSSTSPPSFDVECILDAVRNEWSIPRALKRSAVALLHEEQQHAVSEGNGDVPATADQQRADNGHNRHHPIVRSVSTASKRSVEVLTPTRSRAMNNKNANTNSGGGGAKALPRQQNEPWKPSERSGARQHPHTARATTGDAHRLSTATTTASTKSKAAEVAMRSRQRTHLYASTQRYINLLNSSAFESSARRGSSNDGTPRRLLVTNGSLAGSFGPGRRGSLSASFNRRMNFRRASSVSPPQVSNGSGLSGGVSVGASFGAVPHFLARSHSVEPGTHHHHHNHHHNQAANPFLLRDGSVIDISTLPPPPETVSLLVASMVKPRAQNLTDGELWSLFARRVAAGSFVGRRGLLDLVEQCLCAEALLEGGEVDTCLREMSFNVFERKRIVGMARRLPV